MHVQPGTPVTEDDPCDRTCHAPSRLAARRFRRGRPFAAGKERYFLLVEVNLPIWVPDFFVFVGVFRGLCAKMPWLFRLMKY